MESITSFFRRNETPIPPSVQSGFWGYLERDLVQSDKRVIVFEFPRVICGADSVEEATDFLQREQQAGRVHVAEVYEHEHDTKLWRRVEAGKPPSPESLPPVQDSRPRCNFYMLGTPGQSHR